MLALCDHSRLRGCAINNLRKYGRISFNLAVQESEDLLQTAIAKMTELSASYPDRFDSFSSMQGFYSYVYSVIKRVYVHYLCRLMTQKRAGDGMYFGKSRGRNVVKPNKIRELQLSALSSQQLDQIVYLREGDDVPFTSDVFAHADLLCQHLVKVRDKTPDKVQIFEMMTYEDWTLAEATDEFGPRLFPDLDRRGQMMKIKSYHNDSASV